MHKSVPRGAWLTYLHLRRKTGAMPVLTENTSVRSPQEHRPVRMPSAVFTPALILLISPEPKFCPLYVAIVCPIAIIPCIRRLCSFPVAVNAATAVEPNRLMADCIIIVPEEVIANCNAMGIPAAN